MRVRQIRIGADCRLGVFLGLIVTVGADQRQGVVVMIGCVTGTQSNGLFEIVERFGHVAHFGQDSAVEIPRGIVVGIGSEGVL